MGALVEPGHCEPVARAPRDLARSPCGPVRFPVGSRGLPVLPRRGSTQHARYCSMITGTYWASPVRRPDSPGPSLVPLVYSPRCPW